MQLSIRFLSAAILVISSSSFAADLPTPNIPNIEAFRRWQAKPYDIDGLDFAKLKTKSVACGDTLLRPLSTDQSTKKYHRFIVGSYNHAKLKGNSEACATSSYTNFCLRPHTIEYAVMSDTFVDSCGNTYRAFWDVLFFTQHENMGTLCSLGRTFYEKTNSEFPGEYETGPTYAVEAKSFLFFTELFATDLKK
jgi:hypothetical protein